MTSRAFLFHGFLVIVVPLCLLAFWWQLHQALGGNSLSWAYTVEWPFFEARDALHPFPPTTARIWRKADQMRL